MKHKLHAWAKLFPDVWVCKQCNIVRRMEFDTTRRSPSTPWVRGVYIFKYSNGDKESLYAKDFPCEQPTRQERT